MPDRPSSSGARTPVGAFAPSWALLVLILPDAARAEHALTLLIDLDIDATVLEARGLAEFLRDEAPIYREIAALLASATPRRVAFSVTSADRADLALAAIAGTASDDRPPAAIAFSVPLSNAVGLRRV